MVLEVTASDPGERRVLGPPRPTTVALAALLIPEAVFICTVVPISDDGGYRSFLGYMTFLTALLWVAAAGITCRIEARRDSLDVVNLFTVTRIPVEEITAVEGRNGVLIRTSAGHRYGSFPYGSSALQRWFPSRRHRDVAARIEDWSRAAVQAGAGRQGAAVERGPAAQGSAGGTGRPSWRRGVPVASSSSACRGCS